MLIEKMALAHWAWHQDERGGPEVQTNLYSASTCSGLQTAIRSHNRSKETKIMDIATSQGRRMLPISRSKDRMTAARAPPPKAEPVCCASAPKPPPMPRKANRRCFASGSGPLWLALRTCLIACPPLRPIHLTFQMTRFNGPTLQTQFKLKQLAY